METITGAALAAAFHREVVGPLLRRRMPALRYAAGRLGSGSDVLGFDDATSRDHDWGCRLTILVDQADSDATPHLDEVFSRELPERFAGHPVRFSTTWQPTRSHQIEVATVADFAASRLGVRPAMPGPATARTGRPDRPTAGLSTLDWLCVTGQSVREMSGPIFHDQTRELAPVRAMLTWYPPEVDRFVLAAQWRRVAQYLAFVGRTSETGQDLQSRLITASLAGDLIRAAFLVERVWAPYPKWFQAGLRGLDVAAGLEPLLAAAVIADDWRHREQALADAVRLLAARQRARGLPAPDVPVVAFFDRPYRTVDESMVARLLDGVSRPLASLPLVGAIEQWVDSADILAHPHHRGRAVAAYRAWFQAAAGEPGSGSGEEAQTQTKR